MYLSYISDSREEYHEVLSRKVLENEVTMETDSEPLPSHEPDSVEQRIDVLATVLPHSDKNASVKQPASFRSRPVRLLFWMQGHTENAMNI